MLFSSSWENNHSQGIFCQWLGEALLQIAAYFEYVYADHVMPMCFIWV